MPRCPDGIQSYFEALQHGLLALLPLHRVENRDFLLNLYEALQIEDRLTAPDLGHLKVIISMADRAEFPPMLDIKTYAQAEAFLIQACPQSPEKAIRHALAWAFLLLARHGRIEADLPNSRLWLLIWRIVQAFYPVEQGFLSDCIRWMENNQFSPRSILDILREYRKFKAWIPGHGLDFIGQVGNVEVQRYLLDRACGQSNAAKQKILANLRAVFHYYKDTINGGFILPDCVVKVSRSVGVNVTANSAEIDHLWEALEAGKLPAMAGLMLALVLGYGLPLRGLPLLRMTEDAGRLLWLARLPCRRGVREREIQLTLNRPWLAELWEDYRMERKASPDYPYLFTSGHGGRRKRPVSVEFCQRAVQAAVQGLLGYPVPVNHLERGAFKRLARLTSITRFMALTDQAPKGRLSRMMTWLSG